MSLLIDGYNLLNATGIDGRGTAGRTELERARIALLNFLARNLTDNERSATTIVFDAAQAPPGLPSELTHADMQIRFARGYPSADDLIEELIAADHVPRKLVVVSSDHRLHKAARRRRAKILDSEAWLCELEQRDATVTVVPTAPASEKPAVATPRGNWLAEFGSIDVAAVEAEIEAETEIHLPAAPEAWNPFPPGYAADVADEED